MKQLKLQKINNGTKMRFIYVQTNNILNTNVIGFIGNYPEKFKELVEKYFATQLVHRSRCHDSQFVHNRPFSRPAAGPYRARSSAQEGTRPTTPARYFHLHASANVSSPESHA